MAIIKVYLLFLGVCLLPIALFIAATRYAWVLVLNSITVECQRDKTLILQKSAARFAGRGFHRKIALLLAITAAKVPFSFWPRALTLPVVLCSLALIGLQFFEGVSIDQGLKTFGTTLSILCIGTLIFMFLYGAIAIFFWGFVLIFRNRRLGRWGYRQLYRRRPRTSFVAIVRISPGK